MEHNQELKDYKKRVHAKLIAEGERHGWCSQFDDILEELDLPRRKCQYVIEIRVYAAFSSEDDAENFASDLVSKIAVDATVEEVDYTDVYKR